MAHPLVTYLQDHLAGAQFAVSLLKDLSEQGLDPDVARFSKQLLAEVEADRVVLQDCADRIGGETITLKEAAAWVAQKVGRFKLTLNEPIGMFEAIEVLSLGVLGKLALWNALNTIQETDDQFGGINLDELSSRALTQHGQLEELRLKLAASALQGPDTGSP